MSEEAVKQILINDANVNSVLYYGVGQKLIIRYKGGSKIEYSPITAEAFGRILSGNCALSVLNEIRNPNVVGIRIR